MKDFESLIVISKYCKVNCLLYMSENDQLLKTLDI